MKQNRIVPRFLAAVLAVLLLFPSFVTSAQAEVLSSKRTTLAPGLSFYESQYRNANGSKLEERYLICAPGQGSTPVVAYGKTLYGMSTIKYVADYLTGEGKEVVSGINGDFYMTDTGIPIGMVITDGILRTSDAGVAAIGFREDGTAFLGYPNLKVTATTDDGDVVAINYVNKTRKNYGVYLLTSDFSATTHANGESVIVVLGDLSDELAVGGYVNATVTDVLTTAQVRDIQPWEMLLTATVENGNADRLAGLTVGEKVQIKVEPSDPVWTGVVCAVGTGDILVDQGSVRPDLSSVRHPRTAIGILEDGSVLAYVVDGRNANWSVGMSLAELAVRMKELGCVSAANLDGGGSTALIASLPGKTDKATQNKPSEGKLRTGANGIFFLNTSPIIGTASRFYFYPDRVTLLAGTSYQPNAFAADENYHPMPLPADLQWSISGLGTIGQDGTYTAPAGYADTVECTMYANGYSGTLMIDVIDSPDKIHVLKSGVEVSQLRLEPGETVQLTAASEYGGESIDSNSALYRWTADNEIGLISEDGTFTATSTNGMRGTISVSYGKTTAAVDVIVGQGSLVVQDFEKEDALIQEANANGALNCQLQSEFGRVKYGSSSCKLEVIFSEEQQAASLTADWSTPPGARQLKYWIYGDGSGNTFSFSYRLANGSIAASSECTLDFKGYLLKTAAIPDQAISICAVNLMRKTGDRSTVYLDQIVASYSADADTLPPVIADLQIDSQSMSGAAVLSGTITDRELLMEVDDITITMDGVPIDFTRYPESGAVISLPANAENGKLHRLTVTASDYCGNTARSTLLYDLRSGAEISPFADAPGSSAETEANYLYDRGVLNGARDQDGLLKYFPERTMTRAEFAVLMTHFLGIDPAEFAGTVLPFTDADQIDWWAKDAAAAMYALGVINGKLKNDSTVIFDGKASVTRADVATVLGRTLTGNYKGTALHYTDNTELPGYAKSHISVLAEIGALDHNGAFRPSDAATRGEVVRMIYGMY